MIQSKRIVMREEFQEVITVVNGSSVWTVRWSERVMLVA